MLRQEHDFLRLRSVIQADKSVMSDACKTLVLHDFANKFNEYFDLIGLPKMQISCKNGTYSVDITFDAERIKNFQVLK